MSIILFFTVAFLVMTPFSLAQSAFSPIRMFLYGWLLSLGMYASNMIRYETPMSFLTFVVLLSAILLFYFGAYLGRRTPTPSQRPFGAFRDSFDVLTLSLVAGLALCNAAFVLNDFRQYGFSFFINLSTVLGEIRGAQWNDFYSGSVEVNPIRSFCVASAFIMSTLLPSFLRDKKYFRLSISLLCAATLALQGLLDAGRATMGYLVISVVISASLVYGGPAMKKLLTGPRVIVGTFVTFYFFVIFPVQRNPNLQNAVDQYLRFSSQSEVSPWVKSVAAWQGMDWFTIFSYATSYFSRPIDKLNFFISESDLLSSYALGLYNVTLISKVSSALGGANWHTKLRSDIANIMELEGWNPNPWATGVRDLAIDFGLVGAIATLGLLGFIAHTVYIQCLSHRSYVSLATASFIALACMITPFVSFFQVTMLSNAFWLLGAIAFARLLSYYATLGTTERTETLPI